MIVICVCKNSEQWILRDTSIPAFIEVERIGTVDTSWESATEGHQVGGWLLTEMNI